MNSEMLEKLKEARSHFRHDSAVALIDAAIALLPDLVAENKQLREKIEQLKGLIRMALDELGVPSPEYPAPVTNAVEFLKEALRTSGGQTKDGAS